MPLAESVKAEIAAEPLVDRAAVEALKAATGPQVLGSIVDDFWPAADGLCADIAAAGDAEARRRAAHTMKGAAANMGAQRAAFVAKLLEKADESELEPLTAALRAALADARPEFDALISA